ncbi:MAG: tetratricopeptide repeat protein [Elusimicrobiales bacterium]
MTSSGNPPAAPVPAKPGFRADIARPVLAAAALAAVAAVYWPAAGAGFFTWDDAGYVTNNPAVTGRGWGAVFSTSPFGGFYHPLAFLVYKVLYSAFGPQPAAFHLTNISLHLLNCALFYRLALALGLEFAGAVFAAALFALHPMRAESVAWISGMKDPLCCAFFLGALLVYLRYLKSLNWRLLAASAALYAAAVFAKPTIGAGALVFPLLDWRQRRGWSGKIIAEKIPFFLAPAAAALLSFAIGGFLLAAPQSVGDMGFNAGGRIALCGWGILFYLKKLLFPLHLSALYPLVVPPEGFFAAYWPLAAFIALLAWLFRAEKRQYAFGLAFFALAILPALPFFEVFPADRYTYIPAAGIFLIAGIWFGRACEKRKIAAAICAAVLFLTLGQFCARRAALWGRPLDLWNDVLAKNLPPSGGAPLKYYKLAFLPNALLNRGNAYLAMKKYPEALNDYSAALQLNPNQGRAGIVNNMGNIRNVSGDYAAALADYSEAIRLGYNEAYINRGIVYYNLRQYDSALSDFGRIIELQPLRAEGFFRRAGVCLALGRHEDAAADYSRALALDPNQPEAYTNRGAAYTALNRYAEALSDYNAVVRLSPGSAAAYANRGIAYGRSGKHAPALEDFNKALSLEPGNALALAGRKVAIDSLSRAGAK